MTSRCQTSVRSALLPLLALAILAVGCERVEAPDARERQAETRALSDQAARRPPSSPPRPPVFHRMRSQPAAAVDAGDALLIANAHGRVIRVPKDGSGASDLFRLADRVIRDLAVGPSIVAVAHFPPADPGIRTPGRVEVFSRAGESLQSLTEQAIGSTRVAMLDGAPCIAIEEGTQLRIRCYDPASFQLRHDTAVANDGYLTDFFEADGQLVVLSHSGEATSVYALDAGVARQIWRGSLLEAMPAGDDLVFVTNDPTLYPTGSGGTFHPAVIATRSPTGETTALTRPIDGAQHAAAGPTHACVVEYFQRRPSISNRDVLLVPLSGGDPRLALSGVEMAVCLVVDEQHAFVWVRDHGVVRLPIEEP